ncbi:ABC transporter permease [Demequina capsici]|uniref:ABC transporter permease n=1 Tax=Demequina capsici TaxID=3075620 RepID=A0AA96F665_9MICO|nr:ABC transporter permease [Demequina sp. OYTSA14]WNM23903.1 ABC transporter permease [Demequina sp. OYTSA14]
MTVPWNLAAGVGLLLVLAIAALTIAGVRQRRAIATASLRAAAQLAVVALALRGVFSTPPTAIVVLAVMFGVATWTAARRVREHAGALASVAIAILAGASITITIVVGLPTLTRDLRTLIAVSGIVLGGAMTAATLTGRRLTAALRDHRDEVEAWLALGATPREAVRPLTRLAIHEALVPALDQTRTVGLVTLPGAFAGALIGGAAVAEAARFQVVVLIGLLCTEAITAVVLAHRLGAPERLPTSL